MQSWRSVSELKYMCSFPCKVSQHLNQTIPPLRCWTSLISTPSQKEGKNSNIRKKQLKKGISILFATIPIPPLSAIASLLNQIHQPFTTAKRIYTLRKFDYLYSLSISPPLSYDFSSTASDLLSRALFSAILAWNSSQIRLKLKS